jgi:hypothetical protein
MKSHTKYSQEDSFLQQELILGVAAAIGMLLMVASEVLGMMLVMLALLSLAGIYMMRLYSIVKVRGGAVQSCFAWFNNGTMILAIAGILMLMLMNSFRSQVFYSGLALLVIAMIANAFFLKLNFRGVIHITAQLRLLIAMVILLVFFLL